MEDLSWGVRPALAWLAAGAGVLAAVWCALAGSAEDRLVAGVLAAALFLTAATAVRLRRRLTAGPAGFGVRRVLSAERHSWPELAGVATPQRRRRGKSTTTLELDLSDDRLIVLGRLDLGADPVDVARALRAVQQGRK